MNIRPFALIILLFCTKDAYSQQFIGLSANDYSSIQQMPYNPAWVNSSANGTEIHFLSLSLLAGNNALHYSTGSGSVEKETIKNKKHLWENVDILGPAVSFQVREKHRFGVYTRFRQILRAGNLANELFKTLGEEAIDSSLFEKPVDLVRTGFSFSSFAELGFTYGQTLYDNDYHVLTGGVSVKYLMGFSAANLYVPEATMTLGRDDSLHQLTGETFAAYTYNMNPYSTDPGGNIFSFMERGGRGGLGIDIGIQYEHHPNGTPNYETPYQYRIAASITDIGSVNYVADTGSGSYRLTANNLNYNQFSKQEDEDLGLYLNRLKDDSLLQRKESLQKFSLGLPTALRVNSDWVANKNFQVSVNFLLNLRGNGGNRYRPAYVSYFNLTPTYGNRKYSISLPCTFYGRQSLTLGTGFRYGPFYIGSSSVISTLLGKSLRNADLYFGFTMKFRKDMFVI